MKNETTEAGTGDSHIETPAQADGTTRRVFLDRLRKTATVAVPVIAAIALTPSKALASP